MMDNKDPKYNNDIEEAWAYFMDMGMIENLRKQDGIFVKLMFDAYFDLYHDKQK